MSVSRVINIIDDTIIINIINLITTFIIIFTFIYFILITYVYYRQSTVNMKILTETLRIRVPTSSHVILIFFRR